MLNIQELSNDKVVFVPEYYDTDHDLDDCDIIEYRDIFDDKNEIVEFTDELIRQRNKRVFILYDDDEMVEIVRKMH